MAKFKVINKDSKYFGQVLTLVNKGDDTYTLEDNKMSWITFFMWECEEIMNIYMTPEEASIYAKKMAKTETALINWLSEMPSKDVRERIKLILAI